MCRITKIIGVSAATLTWLCLPAQALQAYKTALEAGLRALGAGVDQQTAARVSSPVTGHQPRGNLVSPQGAHRQRSQERSRRLEWLSKEAQVHTLVQGLNDQCTAALAQKSKIPPEEVAELKKVNDDLIASYKRDRMGTFLQRCQEAACSIKIDEKENAHKPEHGPGDRPSNCIGQ